MSKMRLILQEAGILFRFTKEIQGKLHPLCTDASTRGNGSKHFSSFQENIVLSIKTQFYLRKQSSEVVLSKTFLKSLVKFT